MKCFYCNKDNPPGQIHCVKCGTRLDLRPEEVHAILAEKARQEEQAKMEYRTSNLLILAIALFLIGVTLFIVSGEAPKDTYFMPSIVKNTDFTRIKYSFYPPPEPVLFPITKQLKKK